jgi:hypothetical protein
MSLPSGDWVLANVARFLIDGGEEDAASVALSCSVALWESGDTWYAGDEVLSALHVEFSGPRVAYEILKSDKHSVTRAVKKALEAVLPTGTYLKHLTAKMEPVEVDPDWRSELLEIARGRGVNNQIASLPADSRIRTWNNLRFRSESEIRIAKALDAAGVMFLPNCRARVTSAAGRRNREADFLVCQRGKWGVLEVDGEPFHPPSRTVEDHERDRLFRGHGVRVVEHFDANRCFENPEAVVREFLEILSNS